MVQRGILKPKPRPRFAEPMECKRVSRLPEGEDWVYEIKRDGYRAIGLMDGSSAMLYSMSGQNYLQIFDMLPLLLRTSGAGTSCSTAKFTHKRGCAYGWSVIGLQSLLKTQCFDRVQPRRFSRRIIPEKDSNRHREDNGSDNRHRRNQNCPAQ